MTEWGPARNGRARGFAQHGSGTVSDVLRNGLAERAGARLESLARYQVRQFVRWLAPSSLQQVDSVVGSLKARVSCTVRAAAIAEVRNFLHYAADQVRRGLVEFGECMVWTLPAELSAGPACSPGRIASGLVACLMAWSRVHTAVGMVGGLDGEVLRWRWYLGLSTEETSELLGLPPEQCRQSLQRALALVRAEARQKAPGETCQSASHGSGATHEVSRSEKTPRRIDSGRNSHERSGERQRLSP